jgi:hypothetical protein
MRLRSRLFYAAALLSAAVLPAVPIGAVSAQVPAALPAASDMIQEDWQLVIGVPDPVAVGPQITTVMSPDATNKTAPFAAFDMNYLEYPSFFAGGMQVQVWSNDTIITAASQAGGLFNTPGEVVTWTQSMWLSGGQIGYDVDNGQSTTWGQFGQGANLRVGFETQLNSLANYNPATSAKRSGASWESDRVQSLTLVRVRYYSKGVLIGTDNTPRVVVATQTPTAN